MSLGIRAAKRDTTPPALVQQAAVASTCDFSERRRRNKTAAGDAGVTKHYQPVEGVWHSRPRLCIGMKRGGGFPAGFTPEGGRATGLFTSSTGYYGDSSRGMTAATSLKQ
jgi:hypothetical protein